MLILLYILNGRAVAVALFKTRLNMQIKFVKTKGSALKDLTLFVEE